MRRPREASVSFLSIFCRCFLGFVSILHLFSVDVCLGSLSIFFSSSVCIMARVHSNDHKPALRVRIRPPTSGPSYCIVPFIVSSHLVNVPCIVSWLNMVICNRTCTVIYDTIIISKLGLEKLLSAFGRSSVDICLRLCRFFVYYPSMFAWFSVDILFVFYP